MSHGHSVPVFADVCSVALGRTVAVRRTRNRHTPSINVRHTVRPRPPSVIGLLARTVHGWEISAADRLRSAAGLFTTITVTRLAHPYCTARSLGWELGNGILAGILSCIAKTRDILGYRCHQAGSRKPGNADVLCSSLGSDYFIMMNTTRLFVRRQKKTETWMEMIKWVIFKKVRTIFIYYSCFTFVNIVYRHIRLLYVQ